MTSQNSDRTNYSGFLKTAAICSFLGALTTSLLIFLPSPEASDFESRVQLHTNTLYLTKLWILFLHPQFNIIASVGIALVLFKKYPARIAFGLLFLCIWCYTEMSQQAFLLDALNQMWRPAYATAQDEITKTLHRTLIHAASGISDSHYFLVIYGFGLGSLLYGLAFYQEQKLAKWIGVSLLFIGLLSLCSFLRYYLGLTFLSPYVDASYTWIYPYLQPLVRIGIGVWLWKSIQKV